MDHGQRSDQRYISIKPRVRRAPVTSYRVRCYACAQKKVWEVPTAGAVNGGTIATAGNLVFQGPGGRYVCRLCRRQRRAALVIQDRRLKPPGPKAALRRDRVRRSPERSVVAVCGPYALLRPIFRHRSEIELCDQREWRAMFASRVRAGAQRLNVTVLSWTFLVVMLVASGCSIPTRAMTPDGTLRIEMLSSHSFQIADSRYNVSLLLEIAIGRLDTSKVKRVEIYLPPDIGHDALPLEPLYRALGKKKWPMQNEPMWYCYNWTPGKPETATALGACPLITIAM
jgi:hypothetical protein